MITIPIIYVLLIALIHYVSDFIFQTSDMANNKGKSVKWLSLHVFTYSLLTSMAWAVFTLNPWTLFLVFLITFGTHWCTDFVTSKITGYYYLKQEWRKFFDTVGFDQLIHATTLLLTYNYLIN